MFLKGLATAVATLGVGLIPKAPGTFGSLLAVLVWWVVQPQSLGVQATLILVAFLLGWLATHFYEKWNHHHDPKEVVVDELIGMWMTLFAVPKGMFLFVIGFLLFRLFDIWKPGPIGWIDRKVPGALGTILDDIAAGFLALLCMHGGIYLIFLIYQDEWVGL